MDGSSCTDDNGKEVPSVDFNKLRTTLDPSKTRVGEVFIHGDGVEESTTPTNETSYTKSSEKIVDSVPPKKRRNVVGGVAVAGGATAAANANTGSNDDGPLSLLGKIPHDVFVKGIAPCFDRASCNNMMCANQNIKKTISQNVPLHWPQDVNLKTIRAYDSFRDGVGSPCVTTNGKFGKEGYVAVGYKIALQGPGYLSIWNCHEGLLKYSVRQGLPTYNFHNKIVFSPIHHYMLASAYYNFINQANEIVFYDVRHGRIEEHEGEQRSSPVVVHVLRTGPTAIQRIAFAPNGMLLCVDFDHWSIYSNWVGDVSSNDGIVLLKRWYATQLSHRTIAFTSNNDEGGSYISFCDFSQKLRVWKVYLSASEMQSFVNNKVLLHPKPDPIFRIGFPVDSPTVERIQFSPPNSKNSVQYLACSVCDSHIELFSLSSGSSLLKIGVTTISIEREVLSKPCFAFSTTGLMIAVADNCKIQIKRVSDGTTVSTIKIPSRWYVRSLIFVDNTDSTLLAAIEDTDDTGKFLFRLFKLK